MGQLKLTLRQRAALAAANSQAATASQLTPPTSDVNMDGVETHPHQVCLLFLFSSTLDCTSLGASSYPHENRKAFSCVDDASLSISKPSLDLQLERLPDARSQTLDIARLGAQKYTLDQAATSFEIMQIKTQLEKYGEDIAENEAMVTNTGNKVERLEGDIEAVDKATGNRFLDEEILRQKLSDQVEDSLDEFYEFKKEMDKK
ncbi:hypothetical protein FIE12Z_5772 [Fusarium flagelliforme]|uniref:Uncharacterized protein n=1 Tax=Fusarium flagelliforme TaxID=2675880 RepID=A0A395MPU7_9HYPO|nr:hypothetical protein FIE12Z_5772 [Fusarium flagelliforme]